MGVRWAVLCLAIVGCATAPVRDEDAERVDKAMGGGKNDQPAEGLPYGQEPGRAVAPVVDNPFDLPNPYGGYPPMRRRRITPPGEVNVPPVTVNPYGT